MSDTLQNLFNQLANAAKAESLSGASNLTLGGLVDALSRHPQEEPCVVECDGVQSSFGELGSYRGYYSDLAIEPGADTATVGGAVKALKESIGKTYTGYKGGDYTMGPKTLVWVSEYGDCWDFLVSGVENRGHAVVITTATPEA